MHIYTEMVKLPEYIAICIPFSVKGEEAKLIWCTAWLTKICVHRLLNDVKDNELLVDLPQTRFITYAQSRCYDILPNCRYINGIATLIHSTLRSAKALGVNIKDIELKDWLLFQSPAEKQCKGNANIRLITVNKAEILVFNYKGESKRIRVSLRVPKGYRKLVEALVKKALKREVGYPARVYIKEYNFYQGNIHLYCEVQVGVPFELYLEVMRRYAEPKGDLTGGVDVNCDRINLAIVDKYGKIRDVKTFWFREVTARGYRREPAWTKICQAIHEMLNYAYHHGVSTIALENPEVLGYLKYYWIKQGERKSRNYNWKVLTFRNSIIERIAWKAPLYAIKVVYVDPKGTTHSKEHEEIMRKYGLDRHTASAYLIAIKITSLI